MEMNGTEGKGRELVEGKANNKNVRIGDLVLRVLGLGLILVATILVGVDKQTKVVALKLVDSLPPLNLPVTAKWHYLSAFKYFVVANAIACAYAAVSVVVAVAKRGGGGSKGLLLRALIIIGDAMMVALLFSANGATIAVGLLGYQGNSHVRWNKVCNVFGKFCRQLAVGAALSSLGSIAFLILLLLPLLTFHRKY